MLFIKGIVIGIGKIVPGLSGSMLAISMGVYQKLLNSINNFFLDVKTNFNFLFNIFLGIAVSIIFFSNIILYLLNKFYISTIFLFIGLIIGSLIDVKREIKLINKKVIILSTILPISISFINVSNNINVQNVVIKFLYYIFVGIVDAVTMVIPGISGTAALMMIGAYNELISTFSSVLIFNKLFQNILILLPFGIGLIIGVFMSIKLITHLFKYYKNNTYNAILGFGISTIIFLFVKCFKSNYTFCELIIAFLLLIIGYFFQKKINQYISND